MPAYAYVRYKDNNSFAIVPVTDVRGFHPANKNEFSARTYFVKWTDADGESDYYASRILVLGDSEKEIQATLESGRLRVQKSFDSSTSEDEPNEMEKERKKKRTMPKNDLLEMIEKKKRKINQAARSEETEKMQGKLERAEKELKKKEEMIASLKRTIEKQEERILKLSTLNEGLQETIIKMKDVEAPVYPKEFVTPPRPQQHSTANNSGAVQACLKSPASPPPSTLDHSVAQEDPLSDKIDLGNGLLIKRTTWKTIEGRTKDSLFVKDLLVAVWDPAVLLTKSLEGKHCPRHPGRQIKEPLTPWKVAVLKDCYRECLRAQGFPEGHLENALKSFNRFISEKISDIEKTAKRYV
ncbi:hypothetical protein V5799_024912 [Amblyomma americanum]|uniref:BEN domain-containing protein n=1 Tax=Amblyomma americanum TaxID=6943 RepID=A0AAQ4EAU4_AMBAM